MKQFGIIVFLALFLAGPAHADEQQAGKSDHRLVKDGIASFETDGFSADFHTRVQVWGGWVDEQALLENGDRMQDPGFRLRRARFGVDGEFLDDFGYRLELDLFDQERTGGPLYEATIDWEPCDYFGMSVGFDKMPVVQSDIQSSARLPHLDRPMGTYLLSPPSSLGMTVHVHPWLDHMTVTLGVYNGLRRLSSNLHEGYEPVGITKGNRLEGLAVAGRLDIVPLNKIGKNLEDLCGCKKFRMAAGVGGFLNNWGELSLNDGTYQTAGVSAYLHAKIIGFHFFGEYSREWVEPQQQPTTPVPVGEVSSERFVANASLGYVISPINLGLAVRGEFIDAQTDVDDEGDEWLVSGTITYYILGEFLKAQIEYIHREELHGQKIKNDAAIAGLQLFF